MNGTRISEYYNQNYTYLFIRLCSYETVNDTRLCQFGLKQTQTLLGHWVYAKNAHDFLGDISQLKQETFTVPIQNGGRFFGNQWIERRKSNNESLIFSATTEQWHLNETKNFSSLECYYKSNISGKEEIQRFQLPYVRSEYYEHTYIELEFSCNIDDNKEVMFDLKERQNYKKQCMRRIRKAEGCNLKIRQDLDDYLVFDSEFIKIRDD